MGKWDKYAVEDTVTAQGGSKWDKYAVEETVIEKPQAKEVKADQPKPTERDIPTVSMDAGGKLTPNDGGFDINNPTRPTGEIAIPKGGITSVALQIENDKIAKNQSEYVKKAKDEIRKLAINTDFSAPPQDPMMGQQQQSIEGGGVGPAVAAKATDYEKALNYIVNPENLPNNQIQLSPEDKAELAQYAQKAAGVAPAIQKYSKDVEANPDDVDALNNLGDNLFHVGDTKNALSAYSKAASIKENGRSLMGLGNVYLKAGDNVNATKAFEDSFTKDGNPDALIKAAYSNSLEGDIDRSEKILNGVKSNFPDYSYGYALSAHNKEVIGDKSGAAVDNAIYEVLRQQELLPESVNADDPNSDYAKERASQQARMQNVADAIAAPINFFGEMEMGTIHGGIEGLQKVGKGLQGVLIGGDKIGAILDILNGAAETVFSGGMAAAPMTNLTFHALPEPVTKVLMQPLSMINALSDSEVEKFSKNGQALTALGNTVVSILFLGAVHGKKPPFTAKEQEAILHIVKGEAITGEASSLKNIVEKAKKYLEESKLSDIQKSAEIYKSIPGELSIEGKIAVAPDLVKREKLSTEMEKASPAFKNYYAEKIKEVDQNIDSKIFINSKLKEQAAEKNLPVKEKVKPAIEKVVPAENVVEPVREKVENVIEEASQEKKNVLPNHAEKIKELTNETPLSEVPVGLSVEYNGEKGTIGKSETGEVLFKSEDGKETIVSGGGDISTLADKGIVRNEGFYSDKRGDYYVKDGKVYEVKDGNLKSVYEGPRSNLSRKESIIKNALKDKEASPVKKVFGEATRLFNELTEAESGPKKRRLAEERRKLMEDNPKIKYIDDNIKEIHKQLEESGLLVKKGNCP
mgnify:CR=1 FL=1